MPLPRAKGARGEQSMLAFYKCPPGGPPPGAAGPLAPCRARCAGARWPPAPWARGSARPSARGRVLPRGSARCGALGPARALCGGARPVPGPWCPAARCPLPAGRPWGAGRPLAAPPGPWPLGGPPPGPPPPARPAQRARGAASPSLPPARGRGGVAGPKGGPACCGVPPPPPPGVWGLWAVVRGAVSAYGGCRQQWCKADTNCEKAHSKPGKALRPQPQGAYAQQAKQSPTATATRRVVHATRPRAPALRKAGHGCQPIPRYSNSVPYSVFPYFRLYSS